MLETYRVYLALKKLIHAMPRNDARQINRATVVKCAISATFCHPQLFEITDARKMKSPFLCNIHAETRKLWRHSAIRVAASRPIPTDALGVSPLARKRGRRVVRLSLPAAENLHKPASRAAKKDRQDLDLKARHTAPTSIGYHCCPVKC